MIREGVELTGTALFVFERLRAEGITHEVWPDAVPESELRFGRCVVVTIRPGEDLVANGAVRVWSREFVTVRVMDAVGDYWPLREDAAKIDAALHGSTGSGSGFQIVSCVRQSPYRDFQVIGGVEYRQLGGTYKALVS